VLSVLSVLSSLSIRKVLAKGPLVGAVAAKISARR
jgi:hypothetical protein